MGCLTLDLSLLKTLSVDFARTRALEESRCDETELASALRLKLDSHQQSMSAGARCCSGRCADYHLVRAIEVQRCLAIATGSGCRYLVLQSVPQSV